jgi:hypothetical protein
MKKRSHTLAVILNFFFVLAFFGSSSTNKIHGSRPQSPQKFFFPFLFFRPHKIILRTLSLSLSVFYYRVTKRSTHPAAGEKEKRKKEETRVESLLLALLFHRSSVLLVLYVPGYRMFFLSQKQDNKSQSEKKKVR